MNKGLSYKWDGLNVARDCKQRVYLSCSYDEKDEVKRYGAKWDKFQKQWFVISLPGVPLTTFEKWISINDEVARYLSCPFDEKDDVKRLGAIFDKKERAWFIPSRLQEQRFERWLPTSSHKRTRDIKDEDDQNTSTKHPKLECGASGCARAVSCTNESVTGACTALRRIHVAIMNCGVFCESCSETQAKLVGLGSGILSK
jgi:hypothetical protein